MSRFFWVRTKKKEITVFPDLFIYFRRVGILLFLAHFWPFFANLVLFWLILVYFGLFFAYFGFLFFMVRFFFFGTYQKKAVHIQMGGGAQKRAAYTSLQFAFSQQ